MAVILPRSISSDISSNMILSPREKEHSEPKQMIFRGDAVFHARLQLLLMQSKLAILNEYSL